MIRYVHEDWFAIVSPELLGKRVKVRMGPGKLPLIWPSWLWGEKADKEASRNGTLPTLPTVFSGVLTQLDYAGYPALILSDHTVIPADGVHAVRVIVPDSKGKIHPGCDWVDVDVAADSGAVSL